MAFVEPSIDQQRDAEANHRGHRLRLSLSCHTSAIGGPPMDVAVPSTPDTAPATTTLIRVEGGDQPKSVRANAGDHDRSQQES
jgi:hypothetical protein